MNTHSRRFGRRMLGVVLGLALVAAACGSDDASSDVTDTPQATTPVSAETTVASGTSPTTSPTSDGAEQRVVSLSPTHTEIMFAIGAGDQLVAVDEFSDYPAEAQQLPNDLSAFDNNVEAIAAYEPDLVLIGGDFNGLGAQLDELGIGWWDGPAALTIDDTYRQITELGAATGHESEAEALIASMQTEIDEIVASTPVPAEPLTFFHEIDDTLFSVDSTTFIGELYALLGLENIADRRRRRFGWIPAAERRVHRVRRPRLHLPGRHQVLRPVARDGGRPSGLGRPERRAEWQRGRTRRRHRVAVGSPSGRLPPSRCPPP